MHIVALQLECSKHVQLAEDGAEVEPGILVLHGRIMGTWGIGYKCCESHAECPSIVPSAAAATVIP